MDLSSGSRAIGCCVPKSVMFPCRACLSILFYAAVGSYGNLCISIPLITKSNYSHNLIVRLNFVPNQPGEEVETVCSDVFL